MTDSLAMEIGKNALILTLQMALPVLIFSLITGLTISILQAVTQIQEFTLTFIPKLLATMLALAIFGPWMLTKLIDFTTSIFVNLPTYIK
ncbi:MAG: EscS/YscS/HrcS family type III secretion system export apparatus protein [Candidatus Aquicultor primus]|uniref:Flagellar biosynthetic protein FliQ n=1 Tax=Candidatus Aquicultor primus TaxID=1797195 RepID=A0A1F2UQL9_9ACTN|nr:MAG: EscS/YscS/HrcS family type III secretion system export apparatus protein [Candidatus Aquicultor primus]HCH00242.1 flagellar biosynthetic protein FliQ [Actinomycetota bacterium]